MLHIQISNRHMCVEAGPASPDAVIKSISALPGLQSRGTVWLGYPNLGTWGSWLWLGISGYICAHIALWKRLYLQTYKTSNTQVHIIITLN
jgi:hypothetical protein